MKIKTRRYYIYYLAVIAGSFVAILPIRLSLYLAEKVGELIFTLLRKERKKALDNLRSAFPEKDEGEIERIAKGVFSNLCKNAVELLNIYKLNRKNVDVWIDASGALEKVDRVRSKGKGGIIFTSHFGNWDLVGLWILLKGYAGTAVVRRVYFDRYEKFMNKVRESKGVRVIYRDESPKKILRVLKNNELIGILADQDMDSVDGIFVNFFGKPAYTPKAPVALSLASGAPLIPCFMVREGSRHKLVVEEPMEIIEKSNKEETIRFNTQRWSEIVESHIRRHPDHWVWMHRRWKTKPA